jgi:hypothetical protein
VHVVGMSFPPFQALTLFGKQIEEGILKGPFWGLAFTESNPDLPVLSQKEYDEKNPCALYLDVGRLTTKGLEQSWLACRTNKAPIPEAWKLFESKLRSRTKCGAIAVHPDGATSILRAHRFTSGAKALNEKGIPMLPAAGVTRIRFGTHTSDDCRSSQV